MPARSAGAAGRRCKAELLLSKAKRAAGVGIVWRFRDEYRIRFWISKAPRKVHRLQHPSVKLGGEFEYAIVPMDLWRSITGDDRPKRAARRGEKKR